jgi:uncharacterized tellurite resistance protein B-like protein
MKFTELLGSFRNGTGTAKSHMKNLIEMAATDGSFMDMEYDLLKSIARRNNISESKLKEIRENPGNIKFEVPVDAREKFHQLYDLVHMMVVDNQIHAEELKLSNLFAVKFGYPREKITELISVIQSNIKNKQAPDETMKRAEMLLN